VLAVARFPVAVRAAAGVSVACAAAWTVLAAGFSIAGVVDELEDAFCIQPVLWSDNEI
jgi:hypothetical protein